MGGLGGGSLLTPPLTPSAARGLSKTRLFVVVHKVRAEVLGFRGRVLVWVLGAWPPTCLPAWPPTGEALPPLLSRAPPLHRSPPLPAAPAAVCGRRGAGPHLPSLPWHGLLRPEEGPRHGPLKGLRLRLVPGARGRRRRAGGRAARLPPRRATRRVGRGAAARAALGVGLPKRGMAWGRWWQAPLRSSAVLQLFVRHAGAAHPLTLPLPPAPAGPAEWH